MWIIRIFTIIDLIVLVVVGLETLFRLKNSEEKRMEDVRKPLLWRLNILMVLTVLTAVFTLINVLYR